MPCNETCPEFILPGKILQGTGAARVKLKIREGVKPERSAPAVKRDYPTLFKVVFHTKVVCQKIQHVPLFMLVTFPKQYCVIRRPRFWR